MMDFLLTDTTGLDLDTVRRNCVTGIAAIYILPFSAMPDAKEFPFLFSL